MAWFLHDTEEANTVHRLKGHIIYPHSRPVRIRYDYGLREGYFNKQALAILHA
jgi:hypothetical protein